MPRSRSSWLVPAGAFVVAVAGLLAIVSGELLSDGEESGRAPSSLSSAAGLSTTEGHRHVPAPTAASPPVVAVEAAPAEGAPEPSPATNGSEPSPAAAALVVERRPARPDHSPAAVARSLSHLETLAARLRAIDELRERLSDEEAIATLSGLLDQDLGEPYEAETLRLSIIGRLGELPGPRADAALVARIDSQRPRPQRLVAIEALAGRPAAGRNELALIVRDDHDTVVQARARWALAQAR